MMIPDAAPPLAIYCSPYGGLGLKTKSFVAARARIDRLLAASVDVVPDQASLAVIEPCSRALAERLAGPLERDVAMRGGGDRGDLAAVVASEAHAHDPVAAEAWQRFGVPTKASVHQSRPAFFVEWQWPVADDPARVTQQIDAWAPFVAQHDQLMKDDYAPRLHLRAIWDHRLRLPSGVVGAPYPPSRIHATLSGRHASAFLDLVLPHQAATAAFLADYQAVNAILGMTVPLRGFKLCAPKKRGPGRAYHRLPG